MSTDLHTLSGAYAVDALSAEEVAEFRTHLEGCAACREEVLELREAAAQMGASEAMAPPAHMRSRVLEAVGRLPQLPPKVAPIERARSARVLPRLLGAAAAVVLVLGGILGVNTLLDDDPSLAPTATEVFQAEDVRTAAVSTDHGRLRVAASPGRDQMAVDTSDLVALSDEKVYQLWTIVDGSADSVGLLEDTAAGAAMPMPPAGAQVAITVEPAGGSAQPTTEPIAQVDPSAI